MTFSYRSWSAYVNSPDGCYADIGIRSNTRATQVRVREGSNTRATARAPRRPRCRRSAAPGGGCPVRWRPPGWSTPARCPGSRAWPMPGGKARCGGPDRGCAAGRSDPAARAGCRHAGRHRGPAGRRGAATPPGWPAAMTPADTDILLICGDSVLPLAEAVEDTWQAMPAPRARATAARPGGVAGHWRRPGRGSRTACPSRSWRPWARAGACCITAAPMAKSLVPAVTTGR
jgi:hypothetical protein